MVATVSQTLSYLQTVFPCELAEVFEFDSASRVLRRSTDGAEFSESDGGVAWQAASQIQTVNIPDLIGQTEFTLPIDTRLSNRSCLIRSLIHHGQHYVISLRGHPLLRAFGTTETRLLQAIAPVVCDAIRISGWLERQIADIAEVKRQMALMMIVNEAMSAVAERGCDRWTAVAQAAQRFFGCNQFFLALFDGRNMLFKPSGEKCKFEDCTAGISYNERRTVFGRDGDEKSGFNPELYKRMGVEGVVETMAFPYRAGGKVAGAVELVNPTEKNVGPTQQNLFSNLIALLLAGITLTSPT
jgi:hypothetical protein